MDSQDVEQSRRTGDGGAEPGGEPKLSVAEQIVKDIADPTKPKTVTPHQLRQLRREYFTVRHGTVKQCGHKLDQMTGPKNNCEYCWWAFFSNHGELVQTADRAYQEQGSEFLDKMRGVKFRKNFLMYMSTLARIQQEAAALKEKDGGREAGEGTSLPNDQGAEVGSGRSAGEDSGHAVQVQGYVPAAGQAGRSADTGDSDESAVLR